MFEFLRSSLTHIVSYLQLTLEAISVLCIVIGLISTFYVVFISRAKDQNIQLAFGKWLALALEFQLAADILVTTVDPDMDSLMRLALIALIRTFLNYFLSKELAEEKKEQAERARNQTKIEN